ncbi:MAG: hypothetical protein NTX86_00650 [Candidatus Dependentiae bacterium]|nr:hypothetical protein [Candidatus Dependentiae bacterium]
MKNIIRINLALSLALCGVINTHAMEQDNKGNTNNNTTLNDNTQRRSQSAPVSTPEHEAKQANPNDQRTQSAPLFSLELSSDAQFRSDVTFTVHGVREEGITLIARPQPFSMHQNSNTITQFLQNLNNAKNQTARSARPEEKKQ